MRIVRWIVLIGIVGFLALAVRDTYRGGYFSLPELTDDEYPISFKNGLRAIVTVEDLRENQPVLPKVVRRLSTLYRDKRLFGVPFNVDFWMEDVWSTCEIPTAHDVEELRSVVPESMQRATLEWFCYVDVYGERYGRGMIFSVPRF